MIDFRGKPSIRASLTTFLLVGAGIFIVAVSLLLDRTIGGFLKERYDADLLGRAQTLITLTKDDDDGIELDFAGEFMPEFDSAEGPEYFEIWLADGSLLERSESLILNDEVFQIPHPYTDAPIFKDIVLESAGPCRFLRISFLPQQEDEDVEGALDPTEAPETAATLLIARKRQEFDRLLYTIRFLIWGSLGVLLILIIILVRIALGKGLKPLDDIRRQVMAIHPKVLDTRIILNKPVIELNPVVDQLNALLVRLEEAVIRERRFTSDVAHELRTPLAELRSLSEVGVKDPGDREMVIGFFDDVHEVSLEMQHLVTNLLDLTRCDSGTQIAIITEVDLQAALDKTWKRAQSAASKRNIRLALRDAEPAMVRSDQLMLEQILQNLLNNAVAYSPPDSAIVLESRYDEDRFRLSLSNQAPNLEPDDLVSMFDRFWRKDSARTHRENAGLGLSLVMSFAEILGIEIDTALRDGILSISLRFPSL